MDAAAFLYARRADDQAGDAPLLPNWSVEDWPALLASMRLGEQERGSMFGEVSFFAGRPRSASVWAIKPTTAYVNHRRHVPNR